MPCRQLPPSSQLPRLKLRRQLLLSLSALLMPAFLLPALLFPSAAGYLQPTGPTTQRALQGAGVDPAVWPRTHGDITRHAIKLLAADGREKAHAALSKPADIASIMDGARMCSHKFYQGVPCTASTLRNSSLF